MSAPSSMPRSTPIHQSSPGFRPFFTMCVILTVAWVIVPGPIPAARSPFHPVPTRCKYSVRDVAFVNVHGKPWQLQLLKPDGISEAVFNAWNKTLTRQLAQSNIGHIWFASDSPQATRLRNRMPHPTEPAIATPPEINAPAMALSGPHDQLIPFPPSPLNLSDQIEQLVNSTARREIIDQVVDSLCVIVLIESDDDASNAVARHTVAEAIKQVNRQMWTLEKATDQGPASVTVTHESLPMESWLLASLEITDTHLPSVAIIYGQGRRLGEVLTGDRLSVEQIVARASICGQDCECSLDREWLYGQQIIHDWDTTHERAAEKSLTFDPHSAFVVAEVAQIIQKNAFSNQPVEQVLLGSGLRVHDLEPISSSSSSSPSNRPPNQSAPASNLKHQEQNGVPTPDNAGLAPLNDESSPKDIPDADSQTQPLRRAIPWPLMIGLFVVAIGIFGWRMFVLK